MTTTAQQIVDLAQDASALNTPLTSDRTEMLSRIRADQQALFTAIAGLTRDRFQTTATLTSTAAASARVLNLSSLAVERVLQVTLADGREANQVDVLDVEAELAPRYIVRGQTLIEVSNDWNTTSGAAVQATVVYVYGAVDIDPTGTLTQLVTVPDQWIDLLVLPLAIYLFQKDPGRDAAEETRLSSRLDERTQAFVSYLTNYGGVTSRRFAIPSPATVQQKK